MIGIYKITNKINQKIYIGLSRNIEKRWKEHKNIAFNIKSPQYNKHLYKAIRKYGIENFEFTVLEECLENELSQKEIYYIKQFNSFLEGYNETTGGEFYDNPLKGENHFNHKLKVQDIIDIRIRYNNLERKKEVYNLYKNKINFTGFHKIWIGETWKDIIPEVYTDFNIHYHKHNTGNEGSLNERAN